MKKTLLLMSFFSLFTLFASCTKTSSTPSSNGDNTPSGGNGDNTDFPADSSYEVSDVTYHNTTGNTPTVSGLTLYNIMPYADAQSIGTSDNKDNNKALFTIGMADDSTHSYLYLTEDGLALVPAGKRYLQGDFAGHTLTPSKKNGNYQIAIADEYFASKLPNDPQGPLLFKLIFDKFFATYDTSSSRNPATDTNVDMLCSFKKAVQTTKYADESPFVAFSYEDPLSDPLAPDASLGAKLEWTGQADTDDKNATTNVIACKKSPSDFSALHYPNEILQNGYFSITIDKKDDDGNVTETQTFYIGNDTTDTENVFKGDAASAIEAIKAFDPDFTQG